MYSSERFSGATHIARLAGSALYFDAESFDDACRQLIEQAGGFGAPKVEKLNGGSATAATPTPAVEVVAPPTEAKQLKGADPKLRAMIDFAALKEAGFAPKQKTFHNSRGLEQAGEGDAERARHVRAEYERLPKIGPTLREFQDRIDREERDATIVTASDLRMNDKGSIVLPGSNGHRPVMPISQSALGRLMELCDMKGRSYITEECWPELRALNVNHQLAKIGENYELACRYYDEQIQLARRQGWDEPREPQPRTLKLMTRKAARGNAREIYGLGSERYQEGFNAGHIAEALAQALPSDARCEVTYDGRRARFRAIFQTTVEPEHWVEGEIIRTGVQVRTLDGGGGGIGFDGMASQALCNNMMIFDKMVTRIASIRHVGDLGQLVEKFQAAQEKALKAIGHFLTAWNYANDEDVVARSLDITSDEDSVTDLRSCLDGNKPISEVLPGLFNGVIERELVPVRGRRDIVVPQLCRMYEADESAAVQNDRVPLTRSAVVNAFTRYAHEVEAQNGPWGEDEIQSAAGSLLFGARRRDGSRKDPEPLPYIPMPTAAG